MIAELAISLTLTGLGWAIGRTLLPSIGPMILAGLAYPLGASLWVTSAAALLASGLYYHPAAATLVAAAAAILLQRLRPRPVDPTELRWFCGTLAGIAGVTLVLVIGDWTIITQDSFFFVGVAERLLLRHGVSPDLKAVMASFPLFLALVYSAARWLGLEYATAATPLFGLCALLLLGLFGFRGLGRLGATPLVRSALPAAAVLALATSFFYLWGAFYLNGHIVFACLALIAVGSLYFCWLESQPGWLGLGLLATLGLASLRMEAGLSALPILVVAASMSGAPRRARFAAVGSVALAFALWNAYLLAQSFAHGLLTVYQIILIGFCPGAFGGALLVASVLPSGRLDGLIERLLGFLPRAMIVVLILAAAASEVQHPGAAMRALRVFGCFLSDWQQGATLFAVAVGLLFALAPFVAARLPGGPILAYAMTGYLFVTYLIAVQTPHQDCSINDSTNRMLIHALPLLMLYLVLKFGSPGTGDVPRRAAQDEKPG